MFTDNDELSGLIASMMDAQALIILSNIDGIYNGSPADPGSSVIREIDHGNCIILVDNRNNIVLSITVIQFF